MENEKVERLLREARSRIPVNEELKATLRKSLIKKPRPVWRMPWMYAATAAVFLFTFIFSSYQTKYVEAEELVITNAFSFFDIGSGDITAAIHDHGNLYVSIRGQGIFLYTEKGLVKLTGSEADAMSVDRTGTILLFSQEGDIIQLNMKTHKEMEIIRGSSTVSYQQPVWKDKDEMYVTKAGKHEKQIVRFSLKTKMEEVVTDGSMPSVAEHKLLLVFEHDGTVVMKNLRNNEEKTVDKGREPSISKDGRYISYIKEENGLEDVWIIDTDLKTKKKVTANLPLEMGERTEGLYDYRWPIWDSEKNRLFVMKKRNSEEIQAVQLMKIELGTEKLNAEATVERFLQALIVRDDDYAKSLMEQPPEFLTYSNPHYTGYQILGSEEKGSKVHVKAEVYRADTARPYYSVSRYEFELAKVETGYIIQRVMELNMKEIAALDLENLQLISKETQEHLFSVYDVPKQYIKNENIRLGSLVWDQKKDQVMFSVQEMRDETNVAQDETNLSAVTLWIYDRKSKSFTFLDRIDFLNNKKNTVIEGMAISPDGKHLSVDVFSEDQLSEPYVLMYDLTKRKQLARLEQTRSFFWQGDRFMIQRENDYQSMLYEFDPKTNETTF